MTEPAPEARQTRTWTEEYPADWPEELCRAQFATTTWERMDLRPLRHFPKARTSIWAARRSSIKAFKDLLAAHTTASKAE